MMVQIYKYSVETVKLWQRKSSEEIASIESPRRKVKAAIRHAFICAVLLCPAILIIKITLPSWRILRTFTIAEGLLFSLTLFPIIWLLAYLDMRYGGDERTRICSKCFQVSGRSNSEVCHCGGRLEPLDHWEWNDAHE